MDNFDRKIHLINKTKHGIEAIKNAVRADLQNTASIEKSESVSIESILGPGAQERSLQIIGLIRKKFSERNIPEVLLSPVFYKKEKVKNTKSRGYSGPLFVSMFDTNIEDQSLKQLVTFKGLVHELYHSAGRYSFVLTDEQGGVTMKAAASGASFLEKDKDLNEHGNLLEEGAAVDFENELFEEIKNLFPIETVDLYEKIITEMRTQSNRSKYGLNILSQGGDNNWEYADTPSYSDSMEIYIYLKKVVPDFTNLLEQGRVCGKILPLARAIEKTLGSGWYRKLTTAKTHAAKELLEELQHTQASE